MYVSACKHVYACVFVYVVHVCTYVCVIIKL